MKEPINYFWLNCFWCTLLWLVWIMITFFNNLLSMVTIFLQRWMCHISNIKLMYSILLAWILYFFMCLNDNRYWCCVINDLNGTLVEKYHLGMNGVSSTLFFISEMLISKLGMQHKTNFNTFKWKWSFWRNWMVFLSRDAISSLKFWCLLNCSV